ncbi:MAG: c-type cytochrome [Phycisphaeraceae bacterium]|nr:c-type cytochrome [Phycisphaeraceae bacterium]MCW5761814.1 c-type cytochrome [Phycisphaeraceae bacterium]
MNKGEVSTVQRVILLAGVVALATSLGGCRSDRFENPPREFFPDMDHQPRYVPQADSSFFEDGSSARVPDPNVVAFGRASFDPRLHGDAPWSRSFMVERAGFIAEDDAVYRGRAADDSYIDYIPVPVTLERIRRGQERYNIFCAACHGYEGDGKGMVADYFIAPPVSLHLDLYTDPAQRTSFDGYFYEVIRQGVRNMPGYGYSIDAQDTWNIIMYVRALQEARKGSVDDLPAGTRDILLQSRPPAPVEPETSVEPEAPSAQTNGEVGQ